MQKLIDLLNQWLPTTWLYEYYYTICYKEYCWGEVTKIYAKIRAKFIPTGDHDADITHLICLKKYEFVEWLLANKKIDTKWLDVTYIQDKITKKQKRILWVDRVVMLLAISEDPVKSLISILK